MDKIAINETATCACGNVTVKAVGPVISMLLCTCLDCRKSTGTGHSTVTLMGRQNVSIEGPVKGFTRTANSGSLITRNFCPECGTPLYAVTERAPALILLPTGLFDAPGWFAPRQAIFSRTHLDWDSLPDGLPTHDTYRTEAGF
jgi:hypothetical protein